jgi:hypothetical protein
MRAICSKITNIKKTRCDVNFSFQRFLHKQYTSDVFLIVQKKIKGRFHKKSKFCYFFFFFFFFTCTLELMWLEYLETSRVIFPEKKNAMPECPRITKKTSRVKLKSSVDCTGEQKSLKIAEVDSIPKEKVSYLF